MKVPFLDLKAHHEPIRKEIEAEISKVIDANAFAGGKFVQEFEEKFAEYCGAKYAIGVGNGTDAIWLALLALGVGPGDEVITVASTFIATTEAISFCGATPVFVDIDEQTYTMDPALVEKAITPRTKAILPVHLFGQMANMDPILEIAKRKGLPVVEDAAQAHGAEYKGRRAGALGIAGCFSFYPGKNLGAFGEGGAIITNCGDLAKKIQILRDHGQPKKYHHSVIGWNARLDGIQGAVLKIKLQYLDKANDARRAHARLYTQMLHDTQVITPYEAENARHVYHIYAVRVKSRDQILESLAQQGVACGIHYPIPVHLQEAYAFLGLKEGSFPVTERCAAEFLSLPMFPELTQEQVETVVRELKQQMSSLQLVHEPVA